MATNRPDFDKLLARLVGLCAVAVTLLLVRQEVTRPDPAHGSRARRLPQWEALTKGGIHHGPERAPIQIVVFSDFQCPYCRTFAATLATIEQRYGAKVRLTFRNFPIPQLHDHATVAALGAVCAERQGGFRIYHDLVFSLQDSLGALPWGSVAHRAGLADTSAFLDCLGHPSTSAAIEADAQVAATIGVQSTPTVIVNGWLFSGTPSAADIEATLPRRIRLRAD